MTNRRWRALRREVQLRGVGVHSGAPASVRVAPAARGWTVQGVPLSLSLARPAERRSVLELAAGARVETPEHLLAALAGLGIAAADIEVDGGELPALDGSALPFVEGLLEASEALDEAPRRFVVVDSFELTRARDGARCALRPRDGDALIIDCAIAFDHAAIGAQRRRFVLDDGARFASEIAPARTFGLLADAEALRARGLARGASHDNTLVFDDEGPMSAPRFADEPVRHKILDVIGDCALLGAPLCGEVEVVRGGHALLCEVLRAALARGAVTSLSSHPG